MTLHVELNHLSMNVMSAFLLFVCNLKMCCSMLNKCCNSNSDIKFASEIFLQ